MWWYLDVYNGGHLLYIMQILTNAKRFHALFGKKNAHSMHACTDNSRDLEKVL